jgi:AraC-like DNA-binding protein
MASRHAAPQELGAMSLPAWRLKRVTAFVAEHLHEAISLSGMAAAEGLSPMHLAAQFKIATGLRPHHYLIAQRLDRAKQLLEATDEAIMDIAIAVGFQSQAHLATVFKRNEAMTPRQWRAHKRSGQRAVLHSSRRARASAQRSYHAGEAIIGYVQQY